MALGAVRLADGTLWPIPVCLDIPEELAEQVNGRSLALRDPEGVMLAVLHVDRAVRHGHAAARVRLVDVLEIDGRHQSESAKSAKKSSSASIGSTRAAIGSLAKRFWMA